jgi:hypothetical protein
MASVQSTCECLQIEAVTAPQGMGWFSVHTCMLLEMEAPICALSSLHRLHFVLTHFQHASE